MLCRPSPTSMPTCRTTNTNRRRIVPPSALAGASLRERAEQPWILDLRTAIHHHLEPSLFGLARRRVVAHAELHPDHLGAFGDRFVGYGGYFLAAPEDVDHVDRLGNLGERVVDLLAEDLGHAGTRIDGYDAIAMRLEKRHHVVRRPVRALAGTDHGDGAHAAQDAAQIIVAIGIVVHRFSHLGARFSRKASMPSSASRAIILATMTSLV